MEKFDKHVSDEFLANYEEFKLKPLPLIEYLNALIFRRKLTKDMISLGLQVIDMYFEVIKNLEEKYSGKLLVALYRIEDAMMPNYSEERAIL